MGLWNAADEAGKEIKQKQDAQKAQEEAQANAKEDAKKEQQQHEENKQQGMI